MARIPEEDEVGELKADIPVPSVSFLVDTRKFPRSLKRSFRANARNLQWNVGSVAGLGRFLAAELRWLGMTHEEIRRWIAGTRPLCAIRVIRGHFPVRPADRLAEIVVVIALVALSACVARKPKVAPFPEPPRPPIVEEDLTPVGRAEVGILDLNDEPGADKKTVVVSGTLVNRGSRPTRRIIVHVQALDANGTVVTETQGFATPEAIAPGDTGRFTVEMANLPNIQDYHVEVLYKP